MIILKVKRFNDFTCVCPVRIRIEVKETNKEIPSINIFKHDKESNNFIEVDIAGYNDYCMYSSHVVEKGFLKPDNANKFVADIIANIKEEVNKHKGYHWEEESEEIIEI